jgi:cytidylate kinase
MQITIDGPSASGKSTIARIVAEKLGFISLDTGGIYRALAYACRERGVSINDERAILEVLQKVQYKLDRGSNKTPIHRIDGKDVSFLIRSPEISQLASKLATIPKVRDIANEIQRKIAKGNNIVVEGRDTGTIVFPQAEVKIYLTACSKVRAERRFKELKGNKELSLENVLLEMEERDERDMNRDISPLKKAIDSIVIDTSDLSIPEVAKKIIKIANKVKKRSPSWIWAKLIGKERASAGFLYKLNVLFFYCFFKIFYRVKCYGIENIPNGAAIIAPNHVSFIDPPLVGAFYPKEVHVLANEYLFKVPVVGWVIKRLNVHSVSGTAQDSSTIKAVSSVLLKGNQVIIFPEGSRSKTGELLPFKRGVAMLSSLTNAAVVPAVIIGAYQIFPRGAIFPKLWGRCALVFGKPLIWESYEHIEGGKKEQQKAMTDDLEKALKELQAEYRKKLGRL